MSEKLGDYIAKRLSGYTLVISPLQEDLIIEVKARSLYNVLSFLQHDTYCQFEQLVDLVALDNPDQEKRFELVYILQSLKNNKRIHITTRVNSDIFSVSEIYRSASWLEREVWEMFGVVFKNNRDLRKLLTDICFLSYPLRKDFPLSGTSDLVFDEEDKVFMSVPLQLEQEKRLFETNSPWKGSSLVIKEDFLTEKESQEIL